MTHFRSLSSREMVESPRERLTRITKETRRELEERERGRRRSETLALGDDGRESLGGIVHGRPRVLPSFPFIAFQPSLLVYY